MKQADLLKRAIILRRSGHSLKEVSEQMRISKSTASVWLKNTRISFKGIQRIKKISDIGRQKSIITNRKRRLKAYEEMSLNTVDIKKISKKFDKKYYKIFLALLYWGEGAKTGRQLVFMNSDKELIRVYLFLLRNSFAIKEEKLKLYLHLHDYHNREALVEYWSKITSVDKNNIKVYIKNNTGLRKKMDYNGCVSVRYYNSLILDEVLLIIKRFQRVINK